MKRRTHQQTKKEKNLEGFLSQVTDNNNKKALELRHIRLMGGTVTHPAVSLAP